MQYDEKNIPILDYDEEQAIFQKIYSNISVGCQSQENPKFIFIGGLPGAGKSHYTRKIMQKDASLINVSRDKFFNDYPEIERLNKESYTYLNNKNRDLFLADPLYSYAARGVEYALIKSVYNEQNVIYDSIVRPYENDLLDAFANSGYKTDFIFISAPKRILDTHIVDRFFDNQKEVNEGKGILISGVRMQRVPKVLKRNQDCLNIAQDRGHHVRVIDGLSGNLIFDSNNDSRQKAGDVFLEEYQRSLTTEEQGYVNIRQRMITHKMKALDMDTPYHRNVVSSLGLIYNSPVKASKQITHR